MVRVAGLKRRDEAGLQVRSADGLTPREQLARISARTQALAIAHAKVFLDEVCPSWTRRASGSTGGRADRRAAGDAVDLLHRDRVPGADAAGRRPRAPVPLHLRPLAQPGRHRPRPRGPDRAVRAGEGAQQRPAPGPGRPGRPGRRVDHLPANRGPDRRAPVGAVHRHGGGGVPRLPGHAQRGPGGRGGPRRRPAAGAGTRAGPPPVRAAGAARGRRHDEPARTGAAAARAGRRPARRRHRCRGCSTSPRCGSSSAWTGRT